MWLRVVLLVGVAGTLSRAATVDQPAAIRSVFDAVVYNKFIGEQDKELGLWSVRASVFAAASSTAARVLDCAQFNNTVAIIDSQGATWTWKEQFEVVLALQTCGAVAAIQRHADAAPSVLGFGFYNSDHNCCKSQGRQVRIPLLATWHTNLADAQEAVLNNENVTVSVPESSRNPWVEDLYHHPAFIAFARVLLPLANVCVFVMATRATFMHFARWLFPGRFGAAPLMDAVRGYVVLAMLLEAAASAIRVCYCAITPFFSNSALNYQEGMFLLNVSVPLQLPIIFIVSAVLRRMVSNKRTHFGFDARYSAGLGLFCAVLAALQMLGAYGVAYGKAFQVYSELATAVAFIILCVATVVFLATGLPFLRRLREGKRVRRERRDSNAGVTQRARSVRHRFARTIVYGTLGLILQVIVTPFFAVPALFYSPTGFGTLLITYFFGLTLAALFHTQAFAPVIRIRFNKFGGSMRSKGTSNAESLPPGLTQAEGDNVQGICLGGKRDRGAGVDEGRGGVGEEEDNRSESHNEPVQLSSRAVVVAVSSPALSGEGAKEFELAAAGAGSQSSPPPAPAVEEGRPTSPREHTGHEDARSEREDDSRAARPASESSGGGVRVDAPVHDEEAREAVAVGGDGDKEGSEEQAGEDPEMGQRRVSAQVEEDEWDYGEFNDGVFAVEVDRGRAGDVRARNRRLGLQRFLTQRLHQTSFRHALPVSIKAQSEAHGRAFPLMDPRVTASAEDFKRSKSNQSAVN